MKKNILLLSMLLMFAAANAQKQSLTAMYNKVNKTRDISMPKANVWKWDTIVAYDTTNAFYEMHTRQFDPIGNVTTIVIKKWYGGSWVNYERDTYSYAANNDSLTLLIEIWLGGNWVNSSKTIYALDAAGNVLSELVIGWMNPQWENIARDTYTYNPNGNILTKINENWQNNMWNTGQRETYTYDTDGNNILHLYEFWQGGVWQNVNRETFTYDNGGKMLMYLREMTDTAGAWLNEEKYDYFYDSSGNKTGELIWGWVVDSGWYWTQRDTYTYDTYGNMTSWMYETYNYPTNWENGGKWEFTYDLDGNLLSETDYGWFWGNWEYVFRTEFTYDANRNSRTENAYKWFGSWVPWTNSGILYSDKERIYYLSNCYRYEAHYVLLNSCSANFTLYPDTITPHQYYIVNQAAGMPPISYVWSWGDGTFSYTALPSHTYDSAGYYVICLTITDGTGCTTTYCDSSNLAKTINTMITVNVISTTGVSESRIDRSLVIFPNPATTTLTIEGLTQKTTAEVYDISGKLILTTKLVSTQIDISALAQGMYFIKLRTKEGSVVRKFVKE
jgi:hypothetical protein